MKADFSILEAYYDYWLELHHGRAIDIASAQALLRMWSYQGSLRKYEEVLGLTREHLLHSLLALDTERKQTAKNPELERFLRRSQQSVSSVAYLFDIIFPLRRLNLTHALSPDLKAGRKLPAWLRIMPDLLDEPYLTEDALVINFFLIEISPEGHLSINKEPIASYAKNALQELRGD